MIPPPLADIGDRLRRAAGSNDYPAVEGLVTSLCSTALEQAAALPPADPQIREIGAWVDELLDWTGIMLRSSRAAQADELRRIPFVQSYLRQESI
jgi:hypothetical protein